MRRMLAEATAKYLTREIRWTSGRGLAVNVGGISQFREQALQAFCARDKRLELHGAVAARAEEFDVEATLEKLGPRMPSAAAWAVGRSEFALRVAGWMLRVGMLSAACGRFGNQQRAPLCGWRQHSCVANVVETWGGYRGGQTAQQGVEIDGEGAVPAQLRVRTTTCSRTTRKCAALTRSASARLGSCSRKKSSRARMASRSSK